MRKIICIALAAMLVAMSCCSFAQTADKHYQISFSNPSVKLTLPGEETREITLTGLEASYSRGKTDDYKSHVFDLSANGDSAIRAIVMQNAQNILAGIQGMNEVFSWDVGANGKPETSNIDLSALLKFAESFNFVDEGEDTQEFMYGARLSANKTSLELDDGQLNDMLDSFAAAFGLVGFDAEAFKNIEKSVSVDIWTTEDGKYVRIDADIDAASDEESVCIPMNLQGKADGNGTVDILATMTESDGVITLNAHITPDEKHPLRPTMHVVLSAVSDEGDVSSATFTTGSSYDEVSATRAMSFELNVMGETAFKALASKKESAEQNTYAFKAGLNDELTLYCATEPYEDEVGKGEKGYVELNANFGDLTAAAKCDLTMGVRAGALDTGDTQNLKTIDVKNRTAQDLAAVKTDLYLIAFRAIGVLTEIPEVNEFINSTLAA